MLFDNFAQVGFGMRGKNFNDSIIFYPQKEPSILFKLDEFLTVMTREKQLRIWNPKLNLKAHLKQHEKGMRLKELIKHELSPSFQDSELESLLRTVSITFLSKTGNVHLPMLDMDVELTEDEYFFDAGKVKKEIIPNRAGICLRYKIETRRSDTSNPRLTKFAVISYIDANPDLHDIVHRGHEETHVLMYFAKFELFKKELEKYEKIKELGKYNEEDLATIGGYLALKKKYPGTEFSIGEVFNSLKR